MSTEQPSHPMVLWSYRLYNFFVKAVFDENATLVDLSKIVAILAVVIFVLFLLLEPVLDWLARGPLNKIMLKIADVEYNRADVIQMQEFLEIKNKQEFVERYVVGGWPSGMLMLLQHTIGGLCAVPAVLGVGNFSARERSSLACLGIMIEMGWEVQDFARYSFTVFSWEKRVKRSTRQVLS